MHKHLLLGLGVVLCTLAMTTMAGAVTQYVRVAGTDRIDTAVKLANTFVTPPTDEVFVATADNFPDALAAGAAAAYKHAPIILVHTTSLPDEARDEIFTLKPNHVTVVGGPKAISNAVATAVAQAAHDANPNATATRVGGDVGTRYDTAASVSKSAFPGTVPIVYLASGENFPDALAGSAAAGSQGGALLLVQPTGNLSQSFAGELQRLHPSTIVFLGGTNGITQVQEANIKSLAAGNPTFRRDQGSNRYETSVAVAKAAFTGQVPYLFLTTGENYPDGLAAGAIAGDNEVPVLLTRKTCMPQHVADEIATLQPSQVYVMGGTAAVSYSLDEAPPICQ
jgi:putative cell wall-binding protein